MSLVVVCVAVLVGGGGSCYVLATFRFVYCVRKPQRDLCFALFEVQIGRHVRQNRRLWRNKHAQPASNVVPLFLSLTLQHKMIPFMLHFYLLLPPPKSAQLKRNETKRNHTATGVDNRWPNCPLFRVCAFIQHQIPNRD